MSAEPGPGQVLALIAALYDAALSVRPWKEVLEVFLRFVGAPDAFLAASAAERPGAKQVAYVVTPTHFKRIESEPLPGGGDTLQALAMASDTPGQDLVVRGEVARAGAVSRGVHFMAWRKDAGALDAGCRRRMEELAPHLARAMDIHYMLREAETKSGAVAAALDTVSAAMLLFGPDGQVLFANRAARRLLEVRDGLELRQRRGALGMRLEAHDPAVARLLDSAIAASVASRPMATAARAVSVPRPSRKPAYVLQLGPMNQRLEGIAHGTARAMALLVDPAEASRIDVALLQELYGLTAAEAAIAELICQGRTVADVAGELELSPHTVRTHLKHIFRKTGVHRQPELVRLLLLTRGAG